MAAYNFQTRFAAAVESGGKRQTIRAESKRRHARPGDKLQLYTGQRTRSCRKLRDAICSEVCPILIEDNRVTIFHYLDREICENQELETLAQADGFKSWIEMHDWFFQVHGLPFRGVLIQWF